MNYENNIKILNDFEKVLGNGQPVNFQIKDPDGELKKVSKEEFAEWMTNETNEKDIKSPPKESLVYGASADIDGTTYFMERKGKDGSIKESYYQPRSEEEKKLIIERNQKIKEEEKNFSVNQEINDKDIQQTKTETSPNPDKKDQKAEKETKQLDFSQNPDNKEEKENKLADNQESSLSNNKENNQNIYYGIGAVCLVILITSILLRNKRKKIIK